MPDFGCSATEEIKSLITGYVLARVVSFITGYKGIYGQVQQENRRSGL